VNLFERRNDFGMFEKKEKKEKTVYVAAGWNSDAVRMKRQSTHESRAQLKYWQRLCKMQFLEAATKKA
jgi:hypothetical protein